MISVENGFWVDELSDGVLKDESGKVQFSYITEAHFFGPKSYCMKYQLRDPKTVELIGEEKNKIRFKGISNTSKFRYKG
jgi:hypothetical protein